MGEIADMMLDGTLCEGCGVYLGDEDGFPSYCVGCERGRREKRKQRPKNKKKGKDEKQIGTGSVGVLRADTTTIVRSNAGTVGMPKV